MKAGQPGAELCAVGVRSPAAHAPDERSFDRKAMVICHKRSRRARQTETSALALRSQRDPEQPVLTVRFGEPSHEHRPLLPRMNT